MHPQQLGPYRIERQIGRGGMGTVFAAVHVETNEPAAIKVLAAALCADRDFRERFRAEIETLRQLLRPPHKNIVRLLGWNKPEQEDGWSEQEQEDGVLFYAMELIDGTSIEDDLRSGRKFEWAEVKDIAVQVCEALKHAHDRGVVHRDIKPANLLSTRDGVVKVSDFGIAKLWDSVGMTTVGGVMGTAEYMAPEQADGRPVSYRCDLYSLGAVLYRLLAGRPLFEARSVPELLQMQRFAQPESIRRFNREVPLEVEAIVLQLLEKDPERRIPNARALARRLEATFRGLATLRVRQQLGEGNVAEAEPAPPPITGGDPGSAEVAPTRVATSPQSLARRDDIEFEGPAKTNDALRSTMPKASDSAVRKAAMKYTTVDEHPVGEGADEEPTRWMSPQTLLLSIALLAVGLTVYYFLQPPSPDTLYDRVTQRIKQHGDRGLRDSEEDLTTFRDHYPDDPRARDMERLLSDIELINMAARLEQQAKRATLGEHLTPVELAYLEALRLEASDPPGCVAKLMAIDALYEQGKGASSPNARMCVRLAKRKAESLQPQVQKYISLHLGQQKERLDRADQLEAEDADAAAAIRRAVVDLYGDKPWAAAVVERAKQALARAAKQE